MMIQRKCLKSKIQALSLVRLKIIVLHFPGQNISTMGHERHQDKNVVHRVLF